MLATTRAASASTHWRARGIEGAGLVGPDGECRRVTRLVKHVAE